MTKAKPRRWKNCACGCNKWFEARSDRKYFSNLCGERIRKLKYRRSHKHKTHAQNNIRRQYQLNKANDPRRYKALERFIGTFTELKDYYQHQKSLRESR